jgi:purine-nucleoside phosphorylase
VRTAAAAGCRTVVLTNAAGGVREGLRVGQPVLVSDHLNLTARSPLVGARFVDLVDLYSARLRDVVRSVDPDLEEGVYAALPGPTTRPPPRSACCGAWAPTSSACRRARGHRRPCRGHGGPRRLLVTNLAAGMTGSRSTTPRSCRPGAASAARVGELLAQVVEQL